MQSVFPRLLWRTPEKTRTYAAIRIPCNISTAPYYVLLAYFWSVIEVLLAEQSVEGNPGQVAKVQTHAQMKFCNTNFGGITQHLERRVNNVFLLQNESFLSADILPPFLVHHYNQLLTSRFQM